MVYLVSSRLCVIPARGGSKRLPNKSLMMFSGKPLISWTVEAALESKAFKRVLVSTDNPEIAKVSIESGAEVPFLRDRFADDHSPVSLATAHAMIEAQAFWGEKYDTIVQLMPNCPLRNSFDITNHLERFDELGRRFQISCFELGWTNPWWAARLDENGKPSSLFPKAVKQRSQDLETLFCPTGAIWIANAEEFAAQRTFYGHGHTFEPMDRPRAVDIDSKEDFAFAEFIHRFHASVS